MIVTDQRVILISLKKLSADVDISFVPNDQAAFCVCGDSLLVSFKWDWDQLPVCDYIRFLAPSPKTTLMDLSVTNTNTATETHTDGGGWFVGFGF